MIQWEYLTLQFDAYKQTSLKEELNQLGKEGWEICGSFRQHSNSQGTILLKRPLGGNDAVIRRMDS